MAKVFVQLNTSSILKVPFQAFDDFTFLVNGESFKTTRIVADLLSSKICQIHSSDPTINEIVIKTHSKGNFTHFINLLNFNQNEIQDDEIPFFSEIIEKLDCNNIDLIVSNDSTVEITANNVFSLIQKHEKYEKFYSKEIENEIEFISSHFCEIYQNNEEEFMKISFDTLEKIVSHKNLKLKNEDQLLSFINQLYLKEKKI